MRVLGRLLLTDRYGLLVVFSDCPGSVKYDDLVAFRKIYLISRRSTLPTSTQQPTSVRNSFRPRDRELAGARSRVARFTVHGRSTWSACEKLCLARCNDE